MSARPRGVDALDAAIDDRDAVGFVHVARGDDPEYRYLTGDAVGAAVTLVRLPGETHLRVPPTVDPTDVPDAGVATVRVDDRPPGRAAAAVLADAAAEGTVLAPRFVPHDAALHLESAGYDLASTAVLDAERAVKDADERAAIEAVQRAARRGVGRAAEILAAATVDGDALVWRDAPLSTERLRRQVNATLAAEGVDPAGATRVRAGARDETTGSDDASAMELAPGDPVVVAVGPRGAAGYHGALARTFVVDADGGWERRAHVACDAARDVALVEADPGADAGFVGSEIRAETAAFGFALDGEVTRDVGGGIGLSRREDPPLDGDATLAVGNVLRVRAAVSDPAHGRVELVDVVAVDDGGPVVLGDAPTGLDPARW